MSLARHAKRRDANEAGIVRALHDAGAVTFPLDRPCDQLVGYRGRWLTLEIKDGSLPPSRRALTEGEIRFQRVADYHHLPHYVVLDVTQALQAIGACQ